MGGKPVDGTEAYQQLNIMKKPETKAAYAFQFLGQSGVGDIEIAGEARAGSTEGFSVELRLLSIGLDISLFGPDSTLETRQEWGKRL